MSRATRAAGWILVGLFIGLLIAVLAVQVLTRSRWGQERVRIAGLGWFANRINGQLEVGRISSAGLLGGITLHEFAIRDNQGRPFIIADSVEATYSWRTIVRGRIDISHAKIYSPKITIEKLPGDTLWNFEHIFPERPRVPPDTVRKRGLVLLHDTRIVNGFVVLRRPWEPHRPVAPRDTARLLLENERGGPVHVWRFENVNGELDRVLWESPIEKGKLIDVRSLAARGYIYEQPFDLRDARGTLTIIDSVVSLDFPELRLPTTDASIPEGQVVLGNKEVKYNLQIDTDEMHFTDMRWLFPELPKEGVARMNLRVQTLEPKGTLVHARNMNITAPGTQVKGTVGVVFGDTLYFTEVNLVASPLDVEFLDAVLPGELPVEGLLIGTVEVRGPISALETRGDLRYARGPGDGSALRWNGVVDVREGGRGLTALRLVADVTRLDLALIDAFRPGLPISGVLQGRVEASGRLDRGLRVDGTLRHQAEGRPASELTGGGTIQLAADGTILDLRLQAAPLSLDEIAALSPSLAGLRGEARGAVHLFGPTQRLAFAADLGTPAGAVSFESLVARETGGGYSASGAVRGFRPRELSDRFPEATLTGRFTFDVRGQQFNEMTGPVFLDLDSANIGSVPLERGTFRGSLDTGLLLIDTLIASVPGIILSANGSFGLVPERTGEVSVEARAASLEPLETVLFEDVVDPTKPRVAGAASVRGTVTGTLSRFDLDAGGSLDSFVYEGSSVGSAAVQLRGSRSTDQLQLALRGEADSVLVAGRTLDSTAFAVEHVNGTTQLRGTGWNAGRHTITLAASAQAQGAERRIRVDTLAIGADSIAWMLADSAVVRVGPRGLLLDGTVLRRADGAGTLVAGGTLAWAVPGADPAARPIDFSLNARGVSFSDALRALRRDVDASGLMNGSVRITGVAAAPQIHGDLRIDLLRYENARIEQVGATFDYAGERVNARVEGFHFGQRVILADAKIPLDLRFTRGASRRLDLPLDVRIQADSLPAGLALAPFPGFRDVEGFIDGTVEAKGTTREPALGGALTLRRAGATWDATGVRYENVLGTALIEPDRVLAIDLSARATDPRGRNAPDGGVRATGKIGLAHPSDPTLDVRIQADHLLAARRRDVDMTLSGTAFIKGRYQRPEISGDVRVDGGTLFLDEIYRQYLIVGLEDPLLFNVVDTSLVSVRRVLPATTNPFLKNLRVQDANIAVGAGSWLRSREMNVEVAGDLTVDFDRLNTEDFTLTGTLEVVRGTYRFDHKPFARIFEVREGIIEFPGTPGIDPNLDITAAYRARRQQDAIDILARLSGTLQNPRVRLTSDVDPPISESDLASYLFFGAPSSAFGIGTLTNSATSSGTEEDRFGRLGLAAFNAYGFGALASGLQTIAQRYGLVDYVGLTAAETVGSQPGQGLSGIIANTNLEVGWYWSPRTYFAWTQRLGSAGTSGTGGRIEWRFHPTFTAEFFAEDRFARTPCLGLCNQVDTKKVLGFFLFREWGY